MSRPRIRTIKPEGWQDEKVGRASREARLLRVVLISFADDEGRFRLLEQAIVGFGYPYDQDAPRKIGKWIEELVTRGLIQTYTVDGERYGCFAHWHDHQRINRPTPSTIPAPSLIPHGGRTEPSPPEGKGEERMGSSEVVSTPEVGERPPFSVIDGGAANVETDQPLGGIG